MPMSYRIDLVLRLVGGEEGGSIGVFRTIGQAEAWLREDDPA